MKSIHTFFFSNIFQAFIIAFSSNFIPRLVYRYAVNANKTDEGFLNHTLAYFNTSEFQVCQQNSIF